MFHRSPAARNGLIATLLAALVLTGVPAFTQQPPGEKPAEKPGDKQADQQGKRKGNPFAGPEDEKLFIFAGAWLEDVRYAGDPSDSPSGKGRWVARPFYGLFLVLNYDGTGPEGDNHAHGVMAYDHEDRVYRLWWFDDSGGFGEYSGTWKDDNTLVFEHKKQSGGRPFRERITYIHVSDDEVDTKVEQAWGTEAYRLYLEAAARRGQLPEGLRGGQQLGKQGRRRRLNPQEPLPKQQNPPR